MQPTFLLVPGAGGNAGYFQRVTPLLRDAGRSCVAIDLPNWAGATLADQADAIVAAGAAYDSVILVAQSMGGFSAPLACDRLPVAGLVFLNAMIPAPGETAGAWWDNTGQGEAVREHERAEGRDPDAPFDLDRVFLHDVPAEAVQLLEGDDTPADSLFEVPFELETWPEIPITVLSGRDDRLFPYAFQRRIAQERLGLVAEPLPGGHLLALSQPEALTARLLAD